MKIEIILDSNNKIWIIGATDIKIFKDNNIEAIVSSEVLVVKKIPK